MLILILSLVAAAHSHGAASPEWKLPPYRKVTLTNGLILFLTEQRDVPLISFRIVLRAGGVADPAGKEGLASVTGELLRRGTKTRSAEEIASQLDFVGGTLDIHTDVDRTILSAEFLKKDLLLSLDLLNELLRSPTFPEQEVKKLRDQQIDGIKQAKDEARQVVPRYFYAALYGEHPYARPPGGTERSLASIQREDVLSFHRRHYGPGHTIIAVAGDFTASEVETLLTKTFSDGTGGATAKTVDRSPPVPFRGRKLLLVNKPDATQTFFMLGNVGIPRGHPDRAGINVVNTVFGGRFTSMLNEALRINSGLTYGASSRFEALRVAGPFVISSFTRNQTTTNALDMALDILRRLHSEGLSESQLRSAKAYLKGQFPPRLETTDQLAALLADLEFFGLDEREVNEFFARVDAVTVSEARRLIREHFPFDDLVLVLIGKAEEIKSSVSKYAPLMETRDITQPGFN